MSQPDPTAKRPLFSSASTRWATPRSVYEALDAEFGFTFDPCPLMDEDKAGLPLFGTDGLSRSWRGERVFCNPPYGPGVDRWLAKAREPDLAVFLLPARTDTRWWHDYAMGADEIRFLRGRLTFGEATAPAPFPSCVLVYGGAEQGKE